MVRKGGCWLVVGIPVSAVALSLQELVLFEKELRGCRATVGEMADVIPLVVDGRIRVRELHTHTFPLAEFATALRTFNERVDGALKVIVEP